MKNAGSLFLGAVFVCATGALVPPASYAQG